MAENNGLRHMNGESPASTGHFAFLQSRSPAGIVAILAILAAALAAVCQLGGTGEAKAASGAGFLTKAPRSPQRAAPFARKSASAGYVTIARHAFVDLDRLGDSGLSVAILTFAGVNIAPAGLGWKVKKVCSGSTAELRLGGSTFRVPYADDPAIPVSEVATSETAGSRTLLDLSRPIRAGPDDAQAIDMRAASSDHRLDEV